MRTWQETPRGPVECSPETASILRSDPRRRLVAQDTLPGAQVRTEFLVTDHGWQGADPFLYVTRVKRDLEARWQDAEHYRSRLDAERGHRQWVNALRVEIELEGSTP